MLGTVYESTMIHRNRIRLIYPETANDYDYGQAAITGSEQSHFAGSYLHTEADVHVETSLINSQNIGVNSNVGLNLRNEYEHEYLVSQPTVLECGVDTINTVPDVNSITCESTILAMPNEISGEYKNFSGNYQYKLNPWNFKSKAVESVNANIFSTIFMGDTVNTSADTPDSRPVIELYKNNSNQLKVNFSDNPKLVV
jgi:hypothetical protein